MAVQGCVNLSRSTLLRQIEAGIGYGGLKLEHSPWSGSWYAPFLSSDVKIAHHTTPGTHSFLSPYRVPLTDTAELMS
jgi:hypothetical protein